MYFFVILFILLVVIIFNAYGKKDPVSTNQISHKRSFNKELCEPDEVFVMRTEIENQSGHPMARMCIKHTLDDVFVPTDECEYTTVKNSNKIMFIGKTHVDAKETGVFEMQLSIGRRGAYYSHSIAIDCMDFLGFHIHYYNQPSTEKIIILPRRINHSFMSKMIAQGYGDFNAKRGFIDDETTVRAYGEYTGHEPMRHINWKKSAQVGDFVVKQFEPMGTFVTTIVFDITGFAYTKPGSMAYEYLEYAISMLREMFEYFETKRIPYRLYTNAKSPLIQEYTFASDSSGKKSRNRMLHMLGQLEAAPAKSRLMKSNELLDMAIKSSFRGPVAYLAPVKQMSMTVALKKLIKVKGLEIFEFYAENYYKPQEKE